LLKLLSSLTQQADLNGVPAEALLRELHTTGVKFKLLEKFLQPIHLPAGCQWLHILAVELL
jgi:hypothetical protein